MKEYIKQIYNEGFGTTFYVKPVNYLKKKIKNKTLLKIIIWLIKIFYTLAILLLAGIILYRKLK